MTWKTWAWRGAVKSRWEGLGFDSGTFDLFIRMKGGKTRSSLLAALTRPMDRLQLANQLELNWKAVDRHVFLLNRYGLVREEYAVGRTRMYQVTPSGEVLLKLLRDFNGGQ